MKPTLPKIKKRGLYKRLRLLQSEARYLADITLDSGGPSGIEGGVSAPANIVSTIFNLLATLNQLEDALDNTTWE